VNSTKLKSVLDFFPTGTTEGEGHILARAFIRGEEFESLITPPPSSPYLLIGKKGSGKSAVIDYACRAFGEIGIPCLSLKPSDISFIPSSDSLPLGELIRLAKVELARTIAVTLGKEKTGLITGADKILYEQAISAGMQERDAIEMLSGLLPKIAKSISNIDPSGLLVTASKVSESVLSKQTPETLKKLLDAINRSVSSTSGGFYLFIDDTDQVAAPDSSSQLNRIWAFILAARELARDIQQLRCIVSLRDEVWRRITRDGAVQRDQTDHFTTLIRYLNPSNQHIEDIVNRRLELAAEAAGAPAGVRPWNFFFEGEFPKMPMSNAGSSWPDLIVSRSRERPRDAVQLINQLAEHAMSDGREQITERDFSTVMEKFSATRAELISQECERECPQISEIIRSLADVNYEKGSFKASVENFKKHLEGLDGRFGITLFGKAYSSSREEDVFLLWRFLYDIGVVTARVADSTRKHGFRFLLPREDPKFVSKNRWNDMQQAIWEINPAYRDHLISIEKENGKRVELPPTRRKSNRR